MEGYPLRKTRPSQHHINICWNISVKPKGGFRFSNQRFAQQPHFREIQIFHHKVFQNTSWRLHPIWQRRNNTGRLLCFWYPLLTQHAHAGRRTITLQMHSKSRNREVRQRIPWAFPVMKIPEPSTQSHHEASGKALNLRRHHPQSVQLMITINREIQKQSIVLFLSPHVEGNVREDKHKLYEHYRGKNAPKRDLKHRHLTTGSMYEQAQGGKDIQEQGML